MVRRRQKTKTQKSPLRFRLNLLFFIAFLLLAILVAQLGYLQIVYGNKFESQIEQTDKTVVTGNVPRGMVYDAQGRTLVGNSSENAITYTKSINVKSNEMLATAEKLTKYLTVPSTTLQQQDIVDYFLADNNHYKKVVAKLPKSQKYDSEGNDLSASKVYKNVSQYVAKHRDLTLTTEQKEVATLYKKMSGAFQLSTVYLKDDGVTEDEIAQVGEHLSELPGVGVGTNWTRNYPSGSILTSILGTVTTEKQGLPADSLTSMLKTGYSRNDRVGNSYLEKEYESILRGTKSQTQVTVNNDNQVLSEVTQYAGSKGSNLNLTIDSKYQTAVENALKSQFVAAKEAGYTGYSDGAYAIAMDPKTGAIKAMAGIRNDPETNKVTDDALGNINRTFVMGSIVKPATVLGAFMDGVITPDDNTLPDDAIYLPASPIKKSWYPAGTFKTMTAQRALAISSNTYMMHLAMLESNAKYTPSKYIKMNDNIFEKLRDQYQRFGLGYKTGIDLPGEIDGYLGSTTNEYNAIKYGSALDESYGNYDAYTLIQVAQYASTVANGGYRMQPYIVDSIQKTTKSGEKGAVIYQHTPEILNRVDFTNAQLKVVKQGMYDAVNGNDPFMTASALRGMAQKVAAKTGTAQSFYYDQNNPDNTNPPATITHSFIGYAPANDPKVVVAVVMPNFTSDSKSTYSLALAKTMFQDYFKMEGTN